jgi:hypothetical protein
MLGARSVIHASQGGDMILRNRESTASKPEARGSCRCATGKQSSSVHPHRRIQHNRFRRPRDQAHRE